MRTGGSAELRASLAMRPEIGRSKIQIRKPYVECVGTNIPNMSRTTLTAFAAPSLDWAEQLLQASCCLRGQENPACIADFRRLLLLGEHWLVGHLFFLGEPQLPHCRSRCQHAGKFHPSQPFCMQLHDLQRGLVPHVCACK